MGKHTLKKPVIEIDGTDLTKRASEVNMDLPDDDVDVSTFGSDYKEHQKGLSDASMVFNFFQDYDAAKVDAVLWPFKTSEDKFITSVQPFQGEPSLTNPCYVMGCLLFNYTPLSGSVGEANQTNPTFQNATDLGIIKCESKAEKEAAEAELEEAF